MTHSNRGRYAAQMGGPWRLYQRTVPVGMSMLGTIQRGMEIGALAITDAGIYVMLNAGLSKKLDQRKVRAAIEAGAS